MYGIIYTTTCLVDGRKYIGQHKCKNVNDRYLGSGTILKMAIKEYGAENFIRQTLCVCESEEELNQKEIEYIAKYNATESLEFYNVCEGGKANRMIGEMNPMYGMRGELSPSYGHKVSEEHRQILRERMSGVNNPMYGHKYTYEERKKIGDGQRGEKHWNYGKHWSEEVKQKISTTKKEREAAGLYSHKHRHHIVSDEGKKRISEANKGRIPNEQTRQKMREAQTGRKHPDEVKQKIGKGNQRYHNAGGRRGNKPVICVETNIVYASCYDAARAVGCGLSSISACISGSCKTVKGFHWRFATPEEFSGKMVYVA